MCCVSVTNVALQVQGQKEKREQGPAWRAPAAAVIKQGGFIVSGRCCRSTGGPAPCCSWCCLATLTGLLQRASYA